MINVVQIGCGYWGPNLLRNLMAHPEVEVSGVIDINRRVIQRLEDKYPSLPFHCDSSLDILDVWEADAIVISTPAHTHYRLCRDILSSGRHCLVEKPLASSTDECLDLIRIAEKKSVNLMVGHTFLYNAAVVKMKEIIDSGELGEIYYVYAQRLNLGKIRQDVNVLWNLAPHDISIINYWFHEIPDQVTAKGIDFIQPGISDVAFVNMEYASGRHAVLHLSWLDPHKIRQMTVVGSKKMALYDDTAQEKIVIYDKGVDRKHPEKATLGDFEDFGTFQLRLRAGGVRIPEVDFVEPLKVEVDAFIKGIQNKQSPLTDGKNGLETVQVLEAATESLQNSSKAVKVNLA
ncbi:MAG: Gfo/Idh/MocA family oxidoreductase [Candidatus Marinimicrobia bacterium]|nr:Gfo/Idh/MocA family oxidoreductase [Candidatus Neomarinimicrobiota bacterium]